MDPTKLLRLIRKYTSTLLKLWYPRLIDHDYLAISPKKWRVIDDRDPMVIICGNRGGNCDNRGGNRGNRGDIIMLIEHVLTCNYEY